MTCRFLSRHVPAHWLLAGTLAFTPVALAAQDVMPTLNDPRVGLRAGDGNTAGQALSGMRLVTALPKGPGLDSTRGLTFVNSDLAFHGNYAYQGNFSGFMIWDISNPAAPVLKNTTVCPTDQGDPSVYGNLLFISAESPRGRNDCGQQGVPAGSGHERSRGVRIFDVSNPSSPRLVKNVQTCRGSHTNTLVPHPTDKGIVYVYVGGTSGPRDSTEKAGCSLGNPEQNPNTSQYRLDIIKVPLANPEQAEVVTFARVFNDLVRAARGGQPAVPAGRAFGPTGCHDLTSYPAFNLMAGSCGSHGVLLDIRDPEKPVRLSAVSDTNFSLWHTAVFSNDGKKVVFTDEWGGGTAPRCRATDPQRLGGNTVLSIGTNGQMTQHSYFKMLAAQTNQENCVSHNGGLIPVPGRDIMVQGWYQGGVDVIDFTDVNNQIEIAYFDRGPINDSAAVIGGSWGAYWYNGYIYSSELHRGLDVLELTPTPFLSQNEIDAAKLVIMEEYNPQTQPKIVWPAAFPVVRSYLDQLVRNEGLPTARTTAITTALREAEAASGTARRTALTRLATTVDADAARSKDADRVRAMAQAIRDLAAK